MVVYESEPVYIIRIILKRGSFHHRNILRYLRYLISRVFNFAFFAIVKKNREIKDRE